MFAFYKLVMVLLWIIGVVIAKGFWSTCFAFIIPFYSWYLAVEFFLTKYHFQ